MGVLQRSIGSRAVHLYAPGADMRAAARACDALVHRALQLNDVIGKALKMLLRRLARTAGKAAHDHLIPGGSWPTSVRFSGSVSARFHSCLT